MLSPWWACACYAQSSFLPVSFPYTGINAYSTKFADAFSVNTNQALLPFITTPVAGVYAERRFLLKELTACTAAMAWPLKHSGAGVAINYFGSGQFNTSVISVGYGRVLDENIAAGIQFNYTMVRAVGYGSSSMVNGGLGFLWRAADKVYVGMHVNNSAGNRFGESAQEKMAAVFTMGVGYEASDKVFTSVEIIKEAGQPPGINAGMQYVFAKQLVVRVALATGNNNYYIGMGWQWKTFRADVVTAYHTQLGYTPGLLLLFRFKDEPDNLQQ